MSDSLSLHGLQHARPPCPSPTPRVHPNPCPLSWWCHPTISSSVIPFCSCLQSFPASGSFLMSRLFASGGQNSGASASASVLQGWFPLGWAGLISLQSKQLSRVFSNTTAQKHLFFGNNRWRNIPGSWIGRIFSRVMQHENKITTIRKFCTLKRSRQCRTERR